MKKAIFLFEKTILFLKIAVKQQIKIPYVYFFSEKFLYLIKYLSNNRYIITKKHIIIEKITILYIL